MNLPYFDMILSRLECQDPEFEQAFQRHVHFGAWLDPDQAYGDRDDSIRAMDRLCQHLLQLADIQDGQTLLDVGCGFGGTLATIDQQFSGMNLTGLNIDARQLEIARKRVTAKSGNQLQFVVGDACQMAFEQGSFDRILAVECIFHFPSRLAFFEHVARTLRPGGNLTLTDFLQPEGAPPGQFDDPDHPLWGSHRSITLKAYQDLATQVGLVMTHSQDISRNVRPTYQFFGQLLGRHFPAAEDATKMSQFIMDTGCLGYCTLRFDLPSKDRQSHQPDCSTKPENAS